MPQRVLLEFQLGMLALDSVDDRLPTEADRQVLSLALEEAKLSLGGAPEDRPARDVGSITGTCDSELSLCT